MTRTIENQRCPICGMGLLEKRVQDELFEFKGRTLVISDYVTYACNHCGEAIVDPDTLVASGKKLKDFKEGIEQEGAKQ